MKKAFICVFSLMIVSLLSLHADDENSKGKVFSCYWCHSICETKEEVAKPSAESIKQYYYKGKMFKDCDHNWHITRGSKAYPEPLTDGTIVFVKKGDFYGAFKLYDQKHSPESASFKCWYRKGKGTLTGDSVKSGDDVTKRVRDKTYTINFGPFHFEWSIASNGCGYIYYKYFRNEEPPENALSFCVTDLTDISGVDPSDKKWQYRTKSFCPSAFLKPLMHKSEVTSSFKISTYNVSDDVQLNVSQCLVSQTDWKSLSIGQQFSFWIDKLSLKLEKKEQRKVATIPVMFGKFKTNQKYGYCLGLLKDGVFYYYASTVSLQNDKDAFDCLVKTYQANNLNTKGVKREFVTNIKNSEGTSSPSPLP